MAAGKKDGVPKASCGVCHLFRRSTTPGMITWGKCPKVDGWLRAGNAACASYQAGPKDLHYRILMGANIFTIGVNILYGFTLDYTIGNIFSHIFLGTVTFGLLLGFWWAVKTGQFDETIKYRIFENQDEEDSR